MAWTGAPTYFKVSDSCLRITGLSLAISASGTLGQTGSGMQLILPAFCDNWGPYGDITLVDAVQVSYVPNVAKNGGFFPNVGIAKALVTAAGLLAIQFGNGDYICEELEIYLRYH